MVARILVLPSLLLVALATTPGSAGSAAQSGDALAFRFEAVVTSVFDGFGGLGGSVNPGDTLRGVYLFDPFAGNSATPVSGGAAGLYHHDRSPFGVGIRLGRWAFRSDPRPDFDIIVNDEIGPDARDEYGFVSRANEVRGQVLENVIGLLHIDWLASTRADALDGAGLPLGPPPLDLLGGGLLTIRGDCSLCDGPQSFFEIEATLTSLTKPGQRSRVRPIPPPRRKESWFSGD